MLIYFSMIASVIGGDALIKKYVREQEEEGRDRWEIPGGIEIRRLENKGAAAGVLSEHKELLQGLSGAVILMNVLSLWKEHRKHGFSIEGTALALTIGGGLSNLLDRIRTGTVTDYIRFTKCPVRIIRRLVFNVSDFCIIIGGLLFAICEKFRTKS